MKKILSLAFLVGIAFGSYAKASISYTISCTQPHSHYFQVEMVLEGFKEKSLDLKMPVWIPGSYMIREFSKNVENVVAKDEKGMALALDKTSKNTWNVKLAAGKTIVTYSVYAYELSVRASYLDVDHAFINGTSVLFYVDKWQQLPATIKIIPWDKWTKVATSLTLAGEDKWTFKAENYDEIADSPLEIGNHATVNFEVRGVPHTLAIFGTQDFDAKELAEDLKTVCNEAANVVGELPCPTYTFILHCIPNAGGGLEHKNSSVLQTNRVSLTSEPGYSGFLNLVAHEYFHLWNVKRIRPKALGPFNYESENYTHMLWLSEGFTSYYDDYLLRRCGKMDENKFLETVSGAINYNENTPGSQIQPIAEASLDAWIKYYRPNENSSNATISYYSKGSLIAALMDLHILYQTKGEKSLDDVFRYLYNEYYKSQARGFTDEEFQRAVESVSGVPMGNFFKNHIYGTTPPEHALYLGYVGLKLTNTNEGRNDPWLGVSLNTSGGKAIVTAVTRNSAAWNQGIYVNDEIVAINNFRVTGEISNFLFDKKPGDTLQILVSRDGILRTLEITLSKSELVNYRISKTATATEFQKSLYKKWMKADY